MHHFWKWSRVMRLASIPVIMPQTGRQTWTGQKCILFLCQRVKNANKVYKLGRNSKGNSFISSRTLDSSRCILLGAALNRHTNITSVSITNSFILLEIANFFITEAFKEMKVPMKNPWHIIGLRSYSRMESYTVFGTVSFKLCGFNDHRYTCQDGKGNKNTEWSRVYHRNNIYKVDKKSVKLKRFE